MFPCIMYDEKYFCPGWLRHCDTHTLSVVLEKCSLGNRFETGFVAVGGQICDGNYGSATVALVLL